MALRRPGGGRPGSRTFSSRANGDALVYNQSEVLLPYLVARRPELASHIIAFIAEHGTD